LRGAGRDAGHRPLRSGDGTLSPVTDSEPLIGVTGKRRRASDLRGTAESLEHLDGDWYFADNARSVIEAGGLPVNLPLDADPAKLIRRLDGILFTGGADIDPARYGAEAEPESEWSEAERDEFELALARAAIDEALPTLGICRGLQLLNVASGGTLHQHVPEHSRYDITVESAAHTVDFVPGSLLGSMYGGSLKVNSLHHQTVADLGRDLVVTAGSDDSVEGFEHTTLPLLAVQWHPEWLDTRPTDPLFAWLVEAARRRMTAR
jgi:putative glutamine amidotransferase